jgi:hypothetical protein
MRSVIAVAVLLGMAWLHIPALEAQETCFCLRHQDGARLRGCTAFKGPQDFYETATCTDPETGQTSEQMITRDWQQISEGTEGCSPCRPTTARSTDFVPRGDGEEVPEAGPP